MIKEFLYNRKILVLLNYLKSIIIWAIAVLLATYFRYETEIPNEFFRNFFKILSINILIFISVSFVDIEIFGGSSSRTFEEFTSLIRRYVFTGMIGTLLNSLPSNLIVPRSVPILACILALGLILFINKFLYYLSNMKNFKIRSTPIAIYGGGQQGRLLLDKLLTDTKSDWRPVLIIDDYLPAKVKKFESLPVLPNTNFIEIQAKYKFKILVVTFSKISRSKLQNLKILCDSVNVQLFFIPPIKALTGVEFSISDLRSPSMEELIGKSTINIDIVPIRNLISQKIVLVTGAGGSIGSEISRQISRCNPSKLYLLDHDESLLLQTYLSIGDFSFFDQKNLVLADIRDDKRIRSIFESIKPDIVFHAAALKHLVMLEEHPEEALKTNLVGTAIALNASISVGVKIFVNISTDKAADPSSILGQTKYIAERMTAAAGLQVLNSRYVSVRFGNVFGSRGSVLHTFKQQIKNGGPVIVTDRRVKRFFMTVEEATHLVLRAASYGNSGETLILDMGDPVYVKDIAQKLIDASGQNIEILYTGIKKGEKIEESLIGKNEKVLNVDDPFVLKVKVPPCKISTTLPTVQEFLDLYFN